VTGDGHPGAPPLAGRLRVGCRRHRAALEAAAFAGSTVLEQPARAHVSGCRQCQEDLAGLLRAARSLERLGQMARRVDVGSGNWATLRARLEDERRRDRAASRTPWPRASTLALAVAPALVALLFAPLAASPTLDGGAIVGWPAAGRPTVMATDEPGAVVAPAPVDGDRSSRLAAGTRPPPARPIDTVLHGPIDIVRPGQLAGELDVVDPPPGQDITPAASAVRPTTGAGPAGRPATIGADPVSPTETPPAPSPQSPGARGAPRVLE
jgi:hypothetical protein